MEKMALCFHTNQLLDVLYDTKKPFNVIDLIKLPTKLVSRRVCETDLNTIQIIPYITLRDAKTSDIFIYTRGEAGDEKRLHGTCSIGLGGHVDTDLDYKAHPGKYALLSHLASEAVRELKEEVGLEDETLFAQIYDALIMGNFIVLYNNTDSVGRVHVGVSITLSVDKEQLTHTEHDIITKGAWMSNSEISTQSINGMIELERWSEIYIFCQIEPKGIFMPAETPAEHLKTCSSECACHNNKV